MSLFGLGALHANTDALISLIPAKHYDSRADLSNEFHGWDQVRASVGQVAREASTPNVVLASNHYAMCGRLLMEMGDAPNVYCPTARRSAFDFFGRHDIPADATVVVLTDDIHTDLPPGLGSRTCSLSSDVEVERGGRQVAHYFVHSCPPVQGGAMEKRASRD
jgi:hypothetical protein